MQGTTEKCQYNNEILPHKKKFIELKVGEHIIYFNFQ